MGTKIIGLQNCDKCESRFKWSQVFNHLLRGGLRIFSCSQCGTKHEIAFTSSLLLVIAMILSFTTPGIMAYKQGIYNPVSTFLTTFLCVILISLILPYILRYTSSEE